VPIIRFAPWHFAYLILGLLTSGMLPFLLPLMLADTSRQLEMVAYVTGAYNVGLLAAPAFGKLAERQHWYRPIFFGGFISLGLAFAIFPFVSGLLPWFALALLIGAGAGAAATVATLFVVNFSPRTEWEPRIGWLQSFNGAGQLAGLVLGGAIAYGRYDIGFLFGAGLALLAVLVGGIGLPAGARTSTTTNPLRCMPMQPLLGSTQLGPGLGGLLHHSHHLQWTAGLRLSRALRGPFGRFLLAWSAYNLGVSAFFAYYPLIMRQSYGIPPAVTALTYAFAAGIGIFLFIIASRLAIRHGSRVIFQAGLGLRLFGFILLVVPLGIELPGQAEIALVGFVLVMLAWPVLSVSGTALAARLTPIGEGAAIGLLNASGALATIIGTFASGPLVLASGYEFVPLLAIGGLAIAELLMFGNNLQSNPVSPAPSEIPIEWAAGPGQN
jgi:MFS family permease